MTDLSFQLGLLKGYLHANNAPKELFDAVDELRAGVMPGRGSQAPLSMPQFAIAEKPQRVGYDPDDKKLAINLPETTQGEANDLPAAEGGLEAENASVSTGGGTECQKSRWPWTRKAGGIDAPGH
jgi:hypothetical protein